MQIQLQIQIHKYKQSRMADTQQSDTSLADLALPSFFFHVRHQKAWNSLQSSFLRFFCIKWHKNKIYSRLLSPSLWRQTCRRAQHIANEWRNNVQLYTVHEYMWHGSPVTGQDALPFQRRHRPSTLCHRHCSTTTLPLSRCSCLEVLFHLYCVAITAPQLSLSRCSSRHADIQPLHPSTAIKASWLFLYPHYCAARWDHTAAVLGLQQIEGNITDPHQICLASQLYKDQF